MRKGRKQGDEYEYGEARGENLNGRANEARERERESSHGNTIREREIETKKIDGYLRKD